VQPEQLARRRRVVRVVLPVIGVCLLAALAWVWYTWLTRPPGLRLISIAVADYRNPEAPPIAYSYEDVVGLRKLVAADDAGKSAMWSDERRDSIAQLKTALVKEAGPRDNLLIYIKAHGVSLAGRAYLLGGDFELHGDTGRVPIEELLADVSASPARLKLLVLDTGHLRSDPRMGMLVNEFTHLLAGAVADRRDENLWVLTSNSLFEQAQVSLKDNRSAFGYYLAEGLRGAADGEIEGYPKDGFVQLDELYKFVRERVVQYSLLTSAQQQGQTPLLLRGSKGEVTAADHVDIARCSETPSQQETSDATAQSVPPRPDPAKPFLAAQSTPLALAALQPAAESTTNTPAASGSAKEAAAEPRAAGSSETPGGKAPPNETPDSAKDGPREEKSESAKSDDGKKNTVKDASAPDDAKKQPSASQASDAKAGNSKTASAAPKPAKKRTPLEASLYSYFNWLQTPPSRSDGWRPMDYAPDMARLYHEKLSGCRQRALAGYFFLAEPHYQASLQEKLNELNDLQRKIDARGATFMRGQAKPTYERYSDVRAAIQLRNKACHFLPLLVSHYGRLADDSAPSLDRELLNLISATFELDRWLASPQTESAEAFANWQKSLAAHVARVQGQLDKFEQEYNKRRTDQRRAAAAEHNEGAARWLVDLAQSPLATPDDREELQTLAAATARGFAEIEKQGSASMRRPPAAKTEQLRESGWERAISRAKLEVELLTLLLGDANHKQVAALRNQLATASGLASTDARMALARSVGELLNKSYRDVPNQLLAQLRANRNDTLRAAETAIRLSDARDQERIDQVLSQRGQTGWPNPISGVPLAALPNLQRHDRVTIGDESSAGADTRIPLAFQTHQKVAVRLRSNEPLPERLRLKLDYDRQRVAIRNAQQTELAPGVPFPFAGSSDAQTRETTIELEIASLDQRGGASKLEIAWLNEDDTEAAKSTAELAHPEPVFAQLAVFGQKGTANYFWRTDPSGKTYFEAPFSQDGIAQVRLPVFSSHQTLYDFRLTNGAKHPKRYLCEVFSVPHGDDSTALRSPASVIAAAATRGKKLASNPLAVAPGATESIPFFTAEKPAAPEAKAAAEKAAGEKAEAAKAPSDTAAKEPAEEVTAGLVCVLTEEMSSPAGKEDIKPRPQIIVIDVEIQSPQRYIAPTVNYDAASGGISADLRVKDRDLDRLPVSGSNVQIEVVTTEKRALQPPDAKHEATLTRSQPQNTLRTYVRGGTAARAKVYLHVDGYPRAFIYDFPLIANLLEVELKSRSLREIALPANPESFGTYHPGRVEKPLPLRFNFDMPPPSVGRHLARVFIDTQPGGRYEPREDTRLFESYDDRERSIMLLKPKSEPGLALRARVNDFERPLDLKPYRNQAVHLRAQIVRKEGEGEADTPIAEKELVLYLDGEPPILTATGPRRPVYENQPFRVDVKARDEITAVKLVQFAVKTQKNAENKEFDEFVLVDPKPIRPDGAGNYPLQHKFEKEGEQTLYFQAVDMSGNKSGVEEVTVLVRKPAVPIPTTPDKGAPAEEFGKIDGRVVLPDGARGQGLKVTLNGKVTKTAKPDDDGRFVFDRLPAGEYELKLEGIVNNSVGKSEPKKVVVVPGKPSEPVTLTLTR
jgi:hypothetical protein